MKFETGSLSKKVISDFVIFLALKVYLLSRNFCVTKTTSRVRGFLDIFLWKNFCVPICFSFFIPSSFLLLRTCISIAGKTDEYSLYNIKQTDKNWTKEKHLKWSLQTVPITGKHIKMQSLIIFLHRLTKVCYLFMSVLRYIQFFLDLF